MRVPFYWWFPLACAVVGSIWWWRTRDMDFLTPPTDGVLAELRQAVEERPVAPDVRVDAISVPPGDLGMPTPVTGVVAASDAAGPAFDFGDLSAPPALDEYLDQAPLGAEHLTGLAAALEQQGQFKRALLAWERVVDHGKADEGQMVTAVQAIRRLRPSLPAWQVDPESARQVQLCAGAGSAMTDELLPVLERIAEEIGRASGGVLQVSAKVEQGQGAPVRDRPSPVALWLAGPEGGETTSAVVSFTARPGDPLRATVMRLVYQLVTGELAAKGGWPTVAAPADDGAAEALLFRVTRLGWDTLGSTLQPVPVEEAAE